MGSTAIIASIDKELARLHDLRAILMKKERAGKTGTASSGAVKKKAKRQLSPAGRERIAAAQRKRWAAARKQKNQ